MHHLITLSCIFLPQIQLLSFLIFLSNKGIKQNFYRKHLFSQNQCYPLKHLVYLQNHFCLAHHLLLHRVKISKFHCLSIQNVNIYAFFLFLYKFSDDESFLFLPKDGCKSIQHSIFFLGQVIRFFE